MQRDQALLHCLNMLCCLDIMSHAAATGWPCVLLLMPSLATMPRNSGGELVPKRKPNRPLSELDKYVSSGVLLTVSVVVGCCYWHLQHYARAGAGPRVCQGFNCVMMMAMSLRLFPPDHNAHVLTFSQ